jgi:uncharacterized coiled-coil protein SlyX
MLDNATTVAAALSVTGLAVVITLFLRRRAKPDPPRQLGREPENKSLAANAAEKAKTELNLVVHHSEAEIQKAREELKVLNLQRQITAEAMTSVFEAEAQGKISREGRHRLVDQYKAQLKVLDAQIAERRKITELSDLLTERQELIRSFEHRLAEIDAKLRQLNVTPGAASSVPYLPNQSQSTMQASNPAVMPEENSCDQDSKPRERTRNRAEERLDAIREEVLKALERLQKIDSEG